MKELDIGAFIRYDIGTMIGLLCSTPLPAIIREVSIAFSHDLFIISEIKQHEGWVGQRCANIPIFHIEASKKDPTFFESPTLPKHLS